MMDIVKVRRLVKEGKERNARLVEAVKVIIFADGASIRKMMWITVFDRVISTVVVIPRDGDHVHAR